MRIEVTEQPDGLRGGSEVWVRVLANTVVDWPEVRKNLTTEQTAAMRWASSMPVAYEYDHRTPKERAADGYKYEDFWVFSVRSSK